MTHSKYTMLYEEHVWESPTPVKPTGRWQLVITNGNPKLWIEVKQWLWFTRWIDEEHLAIYHVETFENDCK